MKLVVGKVVREVATLEQASRAYQEVRDEKMADGEMRGADFPVGVLQSGRFGKFYVSFNGKIWASHPKHWKAGDEPAFSPK